MKDENKIMQCKGFTKYYHSVKALHNVDLDLYEGEALALLGDNGAGKSTLVKIISGAIKPTNGEIFFMGKKVDIKNTRDAMELGIETNYQDLALFDNQSFVGNIFAGREYVGRGINKFFQFVDEKKMFKEASETINKLSINLPEVNQKAINLSGGQRQAVSIARSIFWGKKVLLLDEPTAALGVKEASNLLDLILKIRKYIKGMIIISHNIEHVLKVADRALILRNGKKVGDVKFKDYKDKNTLNNDIVKMITGAI